MGISINTNVGALSASAAASAINKSMETSMERLSTGKRINTAADDAAGIGIASRMEAQIRGLNQAIRNASDGQSLIDTAEGAHAEVEFILQRMRELAVQSANDTNVAGDRSNLQAEITQLVAEIDRISSQTTWNGERVLDGTFTSKQLQIGADAGQVTSFDIDSIHTTQLGAHKITLETKADATSAIVGDTLALTGYLGSSDVTFDAAASAKDIAAAINAVTANTGVEATAKTKVLLSGLSGSDSIQFDINGVTIANTATIDTDLRALRDSINAVSAASGVTASVGATNASLVLTAIDGRDITIENFDSGGADKTLDVDALDADGDINANATQQTLDDTPTDATVTGFVELTSNKTFSFSATTGTDYADDSADLVNVSAINISSSSGAASAITTIDGALEKISGARANLGAISNRLDSTVKNLTNIATNIQAAQGRIQDADFAAETTSLAKSQILQQASMAMLAQANASKQGVLSLLQR